MKFKSLVLLLLISCTALGQKQSPMGGPPTKEQIVGVWKMVNFEGRDRVNKVDPWPQPYQWFAFYEDGTVHSMMTNTDGTYSAKELKQTFEVLPADGTPIYRYRNGMLIIENSATPDHVEVWGMNLFAKDVADKIKAGDMMMSLDDQSGSENSVIYYRLLRRVE